MTKSICGRSESLEEPSSKLPSKRLYHVTLKRIANKRNDLLAISPLDAGHTVYAIYKRKFRNKKKKRKHKADLYRYIP